MDNRKDEIVSPAVFLTGCINFLLLWDKLPNFQWLTATCVHDAPSSVGGPGSLLHLDGNQVSVTCSSSSSSSKHSGCSQNSVPAVVGLKLPSLSPLTKGCSQLLEAIHCFLPQDPFHHFYFVPLKWVGEFRLLLLDPLMSSADRIRPTQDNFPSDYLQVNYVGDLATFAKAPLP